MDIAASCPTQVRPEVPRGAEGVSGVIRAQATIRDGVVKEVNILSGPKVFHSAVRSAMPTVRIFPRARKRLRLVFSASFMRLFSSA